MKNREIVFVAGVHGVGKSTLCKRLKAISKFDHVSASDLIGNYKKNSADKLVPRPIENQDILIKELENYNLKSDLLLDGHFCIFNEYKNVVKLPIDVYKRMKINKILLLVADPTFIYQNVLNRDLGRSSLNLEDIKTLQKNEIEHSRTVSDALNIPMLEIRANNFLENDFINKFLNNI